MARDLDAVKWDKLSHAYGKARDVPDLLKDLASTSQKKRAAAIFQLGASTCHQGTMYSATAPAVPFLVQQLEAPNVNDKAAILGLLADIATIDDVGPFLLTGVPASIPNLPASF